jgi:hypothetical protein
VKVAAVVAVDQEAVQDLVLDLVHLVLKVLILKQVAKDPMYNLVHHALLQRGHLLINHANNNGHNSIATTTHNQLSLTKIVHESFWLFIC